MADNIDVTPGTGKTIAADDLAGVLYQRVKISQGADGSATDVSSAAPLNVTLANTGANTNKLLVTPDLPTGAATAAKQPALGTAGTASADVISVQGVASMTALKVDGSDVTQPVSGTFWQATQPVSGTVAATQSGTWTVQPGNTANTTAWKVDGSAVTQPVSGTVTANAGSGTMAVSNAGTFAVQVDGAALTSLQLADDVVATLGTTTYTEATTKGTTIGAVRRDADTTLVDTTNEIGPLQMDANGRLKVEVFSGETLPVSGTVAATQSGTWNVTNVSGTVSLPTGASTSALQTTGNTTLGDIDTTVGLTYSEISLIRAAVPVDDAAFTPGSTRIMMSGFEYDDTTPDSVNEGDAGAARMSANRNIYVNIRDNAGNERGLNIDTNGALASTISSGTVTTVTTLTNQSQEGGVAISLNAGAVDTGTRRVVQANGAGKTILSKTGSAASSGNNTIVAAGTNKLKVFAFSLITSSTTAVTCKFQDGASGTDLWSVILQAPTSISTGANLAVSPPAWLFNTSSATLLNLNLSSANAVQWSVSYYDEA